MLPIYRILTPRKVPTGNSHFWRSADGKADDRRRLHSCGNENPIVCAAAYLRTEKHYVKHATRCSHRACLRRDSGVCDTLRRLALIQCRLDEMPTSSATACNSGVWSVAPRPSRA
jgi:hypothetical protein